MKNSYQNDIQTVQLGNIISSVGSLLDRSESMQETLSMFHLEQSAEILLQLLEAGDEPVKTEILTASFLGDVPGGYPEECVGRSRERTDGENRTGR